MSVSNSNQRHMRRRKSAVTATAAAALDVSSKAAASRATAETAQGPAVGCNWSDKNQVSPNRGPAAGAATNGLSVVDDLPDAVPVTALELAVIETYLGNLIDQLLADARATGSTVKATRSFNEGTRPGLPALDRD
jgi:hypothetical protein